MQISQKAAAWTQRWGSLLPLLLATLVWCGACTGYIEGPPTAVGGSTAIANASASYAGGNGLLCQPGLTACSGACVSLSASSEHCGACETKCAVGAVCADGSCDTTCAEGFEKCGATCTNLGTDSAHCGSCDRLCEAGVPCLGGVCGCPEGALFCQGQCFDPRASDLHCGNCETACMGGGVCLDGGCVCPEGAQVCGAECASLNTPEHCGSCQKVCAAGEACAIDACISGSEPCPGSLVRCGDSCVDLASTREHCGACELACPAAQACAAGTCACPEGKTACGNSCVDLSSSSLNCGGCTNTCTAGQSCQAGQCKCASATDVVCENACTDPQNDTNHCGDCATKCLGGLPCTAGKCQCPEGETLCDGKCLSVDSTAEHCGSCGLSCPVGESCLAGECSGAIGDACSSTLALGISIREIAVYQAGKVAIMQNGNAIAKDERTADIIQGKGARVRVFVDLQAGWLNRVVSARLLLTNGELTPSYFSKRTVTQASSDGSFATTFNIDVKAEDIGPSTRYAVELVECGGTPSGSANRARFPMSDNQELVTRKTGALKLRFIPLDANGRTAASDKGRLDGYRNYMERMFPATTVEYTVGGALEISNTISAQGSGWGEALDELSNLHESDNAAADVYYYGLFQPTDNIGGYCGGGCVAGIGFVTGTQSFARHQRVSLGLSFGGTSSAETLAHEIGHNHGRPHSPCGGAGDPDGGYPHDGAKIGWWGFEAPETLHNPATATDIMGYCNDQWISDYVFRSLTSRVAFLNGAQRSLPPSGVMQHFLFLLTDFTGPRWGIERTAPRYPSGEPEQAVVLDAAGVALTSITVYRTVTDHLAGSVILVPYPEPGWHALEIAGEAPLSFGSRSSSQP